MLGKWSRCTCCMKPADHDQKVRGNIGKAWMEVSAQMRWPGRRGVRHDHDQTASETETETERKVEEFEERKMEEMKKKKNEGRTARARGNQQRTLGHPRRASCSSRPGDPQQRGKRKKKKGKKNGKKGGRKCRTRPTAQLRRAKKKKGGCGDGWCWPIRRLSDRTRKRPSRPAGARERPRDELPTAAHSAHCTSRCAHSSSETGETQKRTESGPVARGDSAAAAISTPAAPAAAPGRADARPGPR